MNAIRRLFPVYPLCLVMSAPLMAQEPGPGGREIVITGVRDTHTVRTDDTMVAPPDTAQLLREMPGANINRNGELSGIAQYRGMFGNRMNVSVDGANLGSAGPNAMDAPLHYAPVALLESLTISRGIVPVSAGQETIGGNVSAEIYRGDFTTTDDFRFQSRTYLGAQSVSSGYVGSGFIALANRNHIFRGVLMKEEAGDSNFPGGSILPSEYERERLDLGYGFERGAHSFSVDYARNETGNAGTAALPMDIASVDSDLLSSHYEWQGQRLSLSLDVSLGDVEHWMTNHHLRRPPRDDSGEEDPSRFRRTQALGESTDFKLQAEHDVDNGLWRYGLDGHYVSHDAITTNPHADGFFINNFNNVQRDINGFFVERERDVSNRLRLHTGLRYNHVQMDSGEASANLNPMGADSGMPLMMNAMAATLAERFNASERKQQDNNFDAFARISLSTTGPTTWYAGFARKMRSPSYQERYLWLPLESTGGLADGKTYVGDPGLNAEDSRELELGFDYEEDGLTVYPRFFYKEVLDYIQGTPAEDGPVMDFARMMADMGMGTPGPLQFTNVDASLYGMDIESTYGLNQRIDLRAILNLVRGKRDDIDDRLFRIAPDNMTLALDYMGDDWMATLESVNYARQNRVSGTNEETETGGYSLVNVSGRINFSPGMEFLLGVNNLFDTGHGEHLAGYNRAFNPDIAERERMPGLGRNVYGRFMWYFR